MLRNQKTITYAALGDITNCRQKAVANPTLGNIAAVHHTQLDPVQFLHDSSGFE
jgi:hypothetical protein